MALTVLPLAVCSGAHAGPLLRVRALSHFTELSATPRSEDEVELQGTLQDDLNQPIANAVVTLPSGLAPRACDDSRAITTDHQGKFCAHIRQQGASTRVTFAGDNLLSETSAVVETRAAEQPAVAVLLDTPVEWSRSAAQHVVNLTINTEQPLFATLSLLRDGQVLTTLPRVPFVGARAVVEVPISTLPSAGPITVRAEVVTPGGAPVTFGQLGIDVVSTIRLLHRDPVPQLTRTGDDLLLRFEVSGDPPTVDSGWVELQVDGANVAMAKVVGGLAEIKIALTAARQRSAHLRAAFVPQVPFHTPGVPLEWSVTVQGPRQWLHIPLAAVLLGFGFRLVRMWRRPARESARVTHEAVGGSARVVRLEARAVLDGWEGTVVDAHTGAPIAGAMVALVVPALVPTPPARNAVTDSSGSFRFDKLTPLPEGSRLVVHAEQHSSLTCPAPQPGLLEIALVARRRTLLAALRDWAAPATTPLQPEPTPLELARQAQVSGDEKSADWIRLVDEAVYGQDPVLHSTEAALLGDRPARAQSSSKGR